MLLTNGRAQTSRLVGALLILCLQVVPARSQNDAISIWSEPDYVRQRDCLKLCWRCNTPCPVVHGVIGCANAPFDSCMCREDLRSSASSFLTSCINYRCSSAPTDLTSAVSLYNSYCHLTTSLSAPATNVATSTVGGGEGGSPTVVIITTVTAKSDADRNLTPHYSRKSYLGLFFSLALLTST